MRRTTRQPGDGALAYAARLVIIQRLSATVCGNAESKSTGSPGAKRFSGRTGALAPGSITIAEVSRQAA